jgi:YHS domain-containing protein
MNWLTQNWLWIVLAAGVLFVFSRGRHFGRGGYGPFGNHGGSSGSGDFGHGGHGDGGSSYHGVHPADVTVALDPVTRKDVPTAHAVTSIYQGRIYYFETAESRQRFEASPTQYAREGLGYPIAGPQDRSGQPHSRRRGC